MHGIKLAFAVIFRLRLAVLHAFTHAALVGALILVAAPNLLQFVDELRQARITAAIEVQRQLQEGVEIGQHLLADGGRRGLGVAPAHLARIIDMVDQVMHGPLRRQREPGAQPSHTAAQRVGTFRRYARRVDARPPAALAFQAGQQQQVIVSGAHQRALEHVREVEVGLRRHQEGEQRGDVERLQRGQQAAPARAQARNAGLAQRAFVVGQMGLAAHQQVHVPPAGRPRGIAFPDGHVIAHMVQPGGHAPAFLVAQGIALPCARLGQRVAVGRGVGRRLGFQPFIGRFLDQRQQPDRPAGLAQGRGLGFIQRITTLGARMVEHGVDPVQHLGTVAPRAIGPQHGGAEIGLQHGARRAEQAGVGATETVDRLLGIAHQEHGRLLAKALVAGQPALQDPPLERIGVLELVEQQVLVARVQPHLQVGGGLLVGHQPGRQPFEIREIHRALVVLVALVALEQGIAKPVQRKVDGQHGGLAAARGNLVEPGAVFGMAG
ncbi:hypothetical protein D3C81_910890 [compost metagenome]